MLRTYQKVNEMLIKDEHKYTDLKKLKELDIIVENVLKKYNIELSNYFIRQIINKQKYYVDSTSECVYKSKELIGKQIIAVTNFPSIKIGDVKSEVLVLGVNTDKGVVLLSLDKEVANGERVY